MANCKKCGEEIDFVTAIQLSGKTVPVDPEYVRFDELKYGERLVTDGGNVVQRHHDKSYPTIKGRRIHFDTCKWTL